jgi:hypothetical protein
VAAGHGLVMAKYTVSKALNNAFERPVKPFTAAGVRRVIHFALSARLKALRPAAQRER